MSFAARLTHTVSIIRQDKTGAESDYGHPVTEDQVLSTVKAAIQPRNGREADLVSQGGPAVGDHVIFLLPTDLTTADAILHDHLACPVTADMPSARFEIEVIRNAAGLGHHLEVDVTLVGSPQAAEGS